MEERGALSSIVEVDEDGLTPLGLANAEGKQIGTENLILGSMAVIRQLFKMKKRHDATTLKDHLLQRLRQHLSRQPSVQPLAQKQVPETPQESTVDNTLTGADQKLETKQEKPWKKEKYKDKDGEKAEKGKKGEKGKGEDKYYSKERKWTQQEKPATQTRTRYLQSQQHPQTQTGNQPNPAQEPQQIQQQPQTRQDIPQKKDTPQDASQYNSPQNPTPASTKQTTEPDSIPTKAAVEDPSCDNISRQFYYDDEDEEDQDDAIQLCRGGEGFLLDNPREGAPTDVEDNAQSDSQSGDRTDLVKEDLDDMMDYDELMHKKLVLWSVSDVTLWISSLGMLLRI